MKPLKGNGTVTGRFSCAAPETQELPGTPGHRMQQRSRTPLPKGWVSPDYASLERRFVEARARDEASTIERDTVENRQKDFQG